MIYERWLAEANEKALSDDRERADKESRRLGLLQSIHDAGLSVHAALRSGDREQAVWWSREQARLKGIFLTIQEDA